MSYSSWTSAFQGSPHQNYPHGQHGDPARPGSGGVGPSGQYIPSFRLLELTPKERKRRWIILCFSPLFEGLAICLILLALMAMPHLPENKIVKEEALFFRLAPVPPPHFAKHIPQLVKELPVARLRAAPIVPKMRREEVSKPELQHLTAPKITEPKIELPRTAPAPEAFASVRRPPGPVKRLPVPVHTGNFTPGSGATPTISKRPLREVQTGGFGASNGIPGEPTNDSHSGVARLGSFDLPQGPGYGNGTGGANGVRGVVGSAGFGNAVGRAQSNSAPGKVQMSGFGGVVGGPQIGSSPSTVRQGGFATAVPGPSTPKTRTRASEAAFKPVIILSKPNPVYPSEARQLHIEGDVVLSVVFEASGKVDVLSVVSGLGHGMDQAAIQAAENIRFKPAERDGHPVNSEATVRIIFQLAY